MYITIYEVILPDIKLLILNCLNNSLTRFKYLSIISVQYCELYWV